MNNQNNLNNNSSDQEKPIYFDSNLSNNNFNQLNQTNEFNQPNQVANTNLQTNNNIENINSINQLSNYASLDSSSQLKQVNNFNTLNQNLVSNNQTSNDINATTQTENNSQLNYQHYNSPISDNTNIDIQTNNQSQFNSTQLNNENNDNNNIQEDQKELKIIKNLKNDMLVLFCINLLLIGLLFYTKLYTITDLLVYIINALCLFVGYRAAKQSKNYAGILGVVVGISMILSGSIIDAVLGIFVIIHSFKYNKVIKKRLKSDQNSKKAITWKLWLLVIFIILIARILAILIGSFLEINFSKLECTRSNGDVVVVWFNEDGIRKMTINEEIPDSVELLNYQLQFVSDFTLIKLIDEDLINEYRKAVLEYEIDNGATCKQ